jgi:methyl-accepting chemotaxis protein
MSFASLRISVKLPAIIILAAFISALVTGINSYRTTSNLLVEAATEKLTALMDSRKSALGDYLASIHEDLLVTAASDEVVDAVIHFQKDFEAFAKDGDPVVPLQKI